MKTGAAGEERSVHVTRILVPVEFSACSLQALRQAVALATRLQAKVILVHVVELHVTGSWPFDVARTIADCHSKAASENLEQWAKTEIPGELLDHVSLLYGAPAHEIAAAAKEEDVDLIVIASHCRTGFQHALLGSVTELLVRIAPCPVLVVPIEREHPEISEHIEPAEVPCRS